MMIQSGRLYEFIREMLHIRNEEMEEKTAWEVWLHKIFHLEWQDFRASLNGTNNTRNAAPTHEQTADIVKQSMAIMGSFMQLRGGGQDGTVQTDGSETTKRGNTR